jgi:head-tail adaptor
MIKSNTYIGQLNERVNIIERARVTSATGEKTITDTLFGSFWSKIDDVSGNEEEDGKIIALNVRRYTIQYNPALVEKQITDMYVQDNTGYYNIHSVSYIGYKEYIQLKCSKRE